VTIANDTNDIKPLRHQHIWLMRTNFWHGNEFLLHRNRGSIWICRKGRPQGQSGDTQHWTCIDFNGMKRAWVRKVTMS
jgi:hypothetical protein